MNKLLFIPFIIVVAFSATVFGQSFQYDEYLRWFPVGQCRTIQHFDRELFISSCPEDIRQEYLNKSLQSYPMPGANLPTSLRDSFNIVTSCSFGKLSINQNFAMLEDGSMKILNRKSAINFRIDGKPYSSWSWDRWLTVYKFDELEEKIAQAVQAGEMQQTSTVIYGRPVYYTNNKSDRNSSLFYATDSEELLVASSIDDLRSMITTGMEYTYPLTQILELKELAGEITSKTYFWRFQTNVPLFQATHDYVYLRDPGSPSLKTIQAVIDDMPHFNITAIEWSKNSRKCRYLRGYKNEHTAIAELKKISASAYPWLVNYDFLNGHLISFRPTMRELFKKRIAASNETDVKQDDDLLVQEINDNIDLLAQLVEFLTKESVHK